jgi:hypothetical protein
VWEKGGTSALDEDKDIIGNRGKEKENALVVVVPVSQDVFSKRQRVETSNISAKEYEPLSKEKALTFDLSGYQAGRWINSD